VGPLGSTKARSYLSKAFSQRLLKPAAIRRRLWVMISRLE
jgi:hypothetical protein